MKGVINLKPAVVAGVQPLLKLIIQIVGDFSAVWENFQKLYFIN